MNVFGECFFYDYYLSIFVTATNKQIYLPMPNSSACRGKKPVSYTHLARTEGIQRNLFPELTEEEELVMRILMRQGDLHINAMVVEADIPVNRITPWTKNC